MRLVADRAELQVVRNHKRYRRGGNISQRKLQAIALIAVSTAQGVPEGDAIRQAAEELEYDAQTIKRYWRTVKKAGFESRFPNP
jgi:uncharacterized protein YoaH (UPF0181 family)